MAANPNPSTSPSNLGPLAQKLAPDHSSALQALSQSQLQALQAFTAQLRGHLSASASQPGVTVLFTGPNTAAKLAAAHILSDDLHTDLYRLDHAAIAATNAAPALTATLSPVHIAAPSSSILFFDEADSIFTKRSNIQSSHDRYAIHRPDDASPILKTLRQHPGVTILAVSSIEKCDPALLETPYLTLDFPLAP